MLYFPLLRASVLACDKLARAVFSFLAMICSGSNTFTFSLLMKMKKETQLPYYKIAFLLIFLSSSMVLWLVWGFCWVCFAFFHICTSYKTHFNFFSSFVFLVEVFFLTTSDRTAALAEFPAGSKYLLYLMETDVAFRDLAALFHSGIGVWGATFLVILCPNGFQSNVCTLDRFLGERYLVCKICETMWPPLQSW